MQTTYGLKEGLRSKNREEALLSYSRPRNSGQDQDLAKEQAGGISPLTPQAHRKVTGSVGTQTFGLRMRCGNFFYTFSLFLNPSTPFPIFLFLQGMRNLITHVESIRAVKNA